MTLTRTIRALELRSFTIRVQTLLANDMSAGHHHRGIVIRRLLLGHGTHKDAMENVGGGQRNRHRHFLGRRPVGAVDAHDLLCLGEQRERDASRGCGDEERGFGAEAEERAEFLGEGVGGFAPGGFVVEKGVVGARVDVLVVRECAHQLADFTRVAVLEVLEGGLGILEGC